jgi:hypothetical protein
MNFSNRWFLGLLIVVIGFLFFLRNAGLLPQDFWQYFWPLLVILIGIKIMLPEKE